MTIVRKRKVIKFIESFIFKKGKSKHGKIAYNIYNKKKNIQLNYKPILITGGKGDKKNYFGDVGIKLLADSFGIGQKFLKELLSGEKTQDDYERYILSKRNR